VFDRITEGVAITSAASRNAVVTYCNPAFEAMCGYEPGALLDKPHPVLRAGRAAQHVITSLRRRLLGEESGPVSVAFLRRDGIATWNVVSISPLEKAPAEPRHHLWVHRDISHHMAANELWQRFDFVVNTAPQYMALIDTAYRYEVINRSLARALGGHPRDLTNAHGRQLWGDVLFGDLMKPLLDRCLQGEEMRQQAWVVLPGDAPRYLNLVYTPYRNQQGRITHAVFVGTDISDEKRATDALEAFNMELENRVLERTAELNAALMELDAFNYTIAHDLRTPLRFISSFARAIGDEHGHLLPREAHRNLELITSGVAQMQNLIQELLALSRLGRQPLQRQWVNVNALIEELLVIHEPEMRAQGMKAHAGDLPGVHADPTLLRQAFMNLLSNAVKFCAGREHPRIDIDCVGESEAQVVYRIKDNGPGFSMRHANTIFDAFKQLHEGDAAGGSGLGLAIVKRVAERHGGRVWAEGEEGTGATFYLELPRQAKQDISAGE
jgi:PAS domain S-box-containing protein